MSIRSAGDHRYTLCEVLREINDLHQGDSETDKIIRNKLVLAERMAKKMSRKLLEYNKNAFKDWWDKNPDHEEKILRRLNKSYLVGKIGENDADPNGPMG